MTRQESNEPPDGGTADRPPPTGGGDERRGGGLAGWFGGRRAARTKTWTEGAPVDPDRGATKFAVSPFARFARAHGLSVAGDALVAIALADSFFFAIDPNDARWQVGLYLLLTVAPFGVVAPLLGPAMDRLQGGHRNMVILSALARAVLAVFMAMNIDNLLVFPLAFGMLVMGKTYHVAKSALVPTLVKDETQLVLTNSRLSIISSISAGVVGIPGVLLLTLGDASWTLWFDAVVFLGAAFMASRIPATKVATSPADEIERHELRGSGIVLAASAMGYVRAVVGFLTMLLAFELRGGVDPGPTSTGVEIGHRVRESLGLVRIDLTSGGAPTWHFGLVLVATGIGGLGGAMSSPRLRAVVREEKILAGSLAAVGLAGLLAALAGGLIGAVVMALTVAAAGAMGKQSFDAIVQRDAPEANLGRSFARFESRFQLLWVFGAVIPVAIPIPARVGFVLLGVTAGFAALSYHLGRDPAIAPRRVVASGGKFRRVREWNAGDAPKPRPGPRRPRRPGSRRRNPAAEATDDEARTRSARAEPMSSIDLDALLAEESHEPTREYHLPPAPPPTGPPRLD